MVDKKIKALFYLFIIYVPIIIVVSITDIKASKWVFNYIYGLETNIIKYSLIGIWVYVQSIICFFYYRCFIGIHKIINNHIDIFK